MHTFNLQRFAALTPTLGTYGISNENATTSTATGNNLSAEMKTFYNTNLLTNVRAKYCFNQFGKKQALPKGNGKTIEWRRFKTFAAATTPLTEGLIPDGNKLDVSSLTATLAQYGDYTPITDILQWAAVDPVISESVAEHADQAARTLETITRNVLVAGTNVYRAGGAASNDTLTVANGKITANDVARVATILKQQNTPTIDGYYVAIIHPSVAYDLMLDSGWTDAHKYAAPEEMFNGELGRLHKVRFVESTLAKVEQNSASTPISIYHTIFFGRDAWGVVEPTGMSMRTYIKDASQIGGPLEQFSTVGWKAMHAAKILYPERMVDYISTSTFSTTDAAN
jgi:N4-gp56 family major capsid protein